MSATDKHRTGGSSISDEGVVLLAATGLVVLVVGVAWTSTHLATVVGAPAPPSNPAELVVALVTGDMSWSTAATAAALFQLLVVLGAVATALVLRGQRRRSNGGVRAPRRVDAANRHLGRGRSIAPLTRPHAAAAGRRLGVDVEAVGPGVRVGSTLSGTPLYRSWEDVTLTIAGPRTGKTTAFVVPEILDAPGAVLATSNKRDVVDATRHVRATPGADGRARQVWVFDPQGVVDHPEGGVRQGAPSGAQGCALGDHLGGGPDWWWNPLSYVTDEVRAAQLAAVFFSAATAPGQSTHAYFTNAGRNLLTNLLLAAALDREPLTQVHRWLVGPEDDHPVAVLERYGYGHHAAALSGVQHSAPEQRAGVYGTAQEVAAFLTDHRAMRWATPPEDPTVREFRPEEFVRTHDTLYSLSREGRGNAGPLVTALTVAVCEAAEDHAKARPGGRLETPMIVSLDEAANVCRWRDLPDLYSHYGSRGILVSTYLQSWSQGSEVWGAEGIRKLWSAANVKVYAGGVSEVEFLRELSQLIGEYRAPSRSVSTGRSGRSVTRGESRLETILDVSDLATLERGRAVLLASGVVPVLIRTEPWMAGPYATAVTASICASGTTPSIPPERRAASPLTERER